MPSPFPGMDPFLEAHWGDVHTSLTTYARNQLRPQLPNDLRARVQEYVHLLSNHEDVKRRWAPDVRVVEPERVPIVRAQKAETDVVATPPLKVQFFTEWTERWIEITDSHGDRVVTSIEFLSPGNKKTIAQRAEFQRKQRDLLQAGVNLVEIDLLRGGDWALTVPESEVPGTHSYPYRVVVVRANSPTVAECYPTSLRDPLPVIRIPLRPGDDDVLLQLQPLISAAWEDGDYAGIDYEIAPRPTFRPDDETWIQTQIDAWRTRERNP